MNVLLLPYHYYCYSVETFIFLSCPSFFYAAIEIELLYYTSTRKLSIKCIFILYLNAMIAIYRCCTTLLFQMDQVHFMLLVVDFDSKNCFHFFYKIQSQIVESRLRDFTKNVPLNIKTCLSTFSFVSLTLEAKE